MRRLLPPAWAGLALSAAAGTVGVYIALSAALQARDTATRLVLCGMAAYNVALFVTGLQVYRYARRRGR